MSDLLAPLVVLALFLLAGGVLGVRALRRRRAARRTGTATAGAPRLRVPRPQPARGRDPARRPEQLGIRPLTEDERTRYRTAWEGVQSRAGTQPALALSEADAVLDRMLRVCGYPLEDPRSPSDVVPGWHATVLASFRAGHDVEQVTSTTRYDADQVRAAMLHFGRAFAAVISDGRPGYPEAPVALTSDRRAAPRSQPGR